ncbi:MAG: hypothetical protein H6Q60_125 [Oscillospiraceae bacterium]|nr:hypothetical protein [Oscillospiraceae bacterium]
MIDSYFIQYCAPTLAGMKCGSLFRFPYRSLSELERQVSDANRRLRGKGINITVLRDGKAAALILVYRERMALKELGNPITQRFLTKLGYQDCSVDGFIKEISARMSKQGAFPHEIGLLLQYPLRDVVGFMRNQGKNCKCTGCWKVYGDESESIKRFDRYKKCTDCYLKQFQLGKSIEQLTVAA